MNIGRQLLSTIGDQIESLENLGFVASTIVMSMHEYQQLMEHLAAQAGLDHMEAQVRLLNCDIVVVTAPNMVEVVPDVREMWERGDEFLAQNAASETSEARRVIIPGTSGVESFEII